jgi:hypothetical protein
VNNIFGSGHKIFTFTAKQKPLMKKLILTMAIFAALVACKKKNKETVTPTATNSKLTVSGRASAELDYTVSGREPAPAGTKVTVFVPLNDLRLTFDSTLKDRKAAFVGVVNSSGNYEITFDAPAKLITYTVVPDDFEATVILSTTASTRGVFNGTTTPTASYGGTRNIIDFNY